MLICAEVRHFSCPAYLDSGGRYHRRTSLQLLRPGRASVDIKHCLHWEVDGVIQGKVGKSRQEPLDDNTWTWIQLVINEKAFCWVVSRLARDRPRDAPASHRRIFETEKRRPQPRLRQGLPPDPGLVVMTNLTTRARPQHLQRSRIPSMYVCVSGCLYVFSPYSDLKKLPVIAQ